MEGVLEIIRLIKGCLPHPHQYNTSNSCNVEDVSNDWVVYDKTQDIRANRLGSSLFVTLNQVSFVYLTHKDSKDVGGEVEPWLHVYFRKVHFVEGWAWHIIVIHSSYNNSADYNRSNEQYDQKYLVKTLSQQFLDKKDNWQSETQLDIASHEPVPWHALVIVFSWNEVVDVRNVGPPVLVALLNGGVIVLPDWTRSNILEDIESSQQHYHIDGSKSQESLFVEVQDV